jgi:hypothetical protein
MGGIAMVAVGVSQEPLVISSLSQRWLSRTATSRWLTLARNGLPVTAHILLSVEDIALLKITSSLYLVMLTLLQIGSRLLIHSIFMAFKESLPTRAHAIVTSNSASDILTIDMLQSAGSRNSSTIAEASVN